MAKHEFGIMQTAPQEGKRYDDYEPWKYDCISVDDEHLEGLVSSFDHMDFYWHTLDVKGKGIAYCGVTLIPPDSLPAFIRAIEAVPALSELKKLTEKAMEEDRWMIHYGL